MRFVRATYTNLASQSWCFDPLDLVALPRCNEVRDPSVIFHHTVCYVKESFRELVFPVLQPVESTPDRVYRVGRLLHSVVIKQVCSSLSDSVTTPWEDAIRLVESQGLRQYHNWRCFFYMKARYGKIMEVCVTWSQSKQRWCVAASFPNERALHKGSLLFSPKI